MKKVIALCILFSPFYVLFSLEVNIKITLLNGTENNLLVNDSINEISGVKGHLYFKENGKVIKEYNHASPIVKIQNISALHNISKIEIYMELHDFNDISEFELPQITELIVSYGLNNKSMLSINKMPNLSILYFNFMNITEIKSINLMNTQLKYMEISYSKLQSISKTIFPKTLKYLNILGNGIVLIDEDTINDINSKNIIVISDKKINGINNQIIGDEYTKILPEEYKRFGP